MVMYSLTLSIANLFDMAVQLLDDNIDDFLWTNDHLFGIFPFEPLLRGRVSHHRRFDGSVVGIGRQLKREAGFAIERNRVIDAGLYQVGFVAGGPGGVAN